MMVNLRRATVAMAMVIAMYGILGTTDRASAVDNVEPDIRIELPAADATGVVVDDVHQRAFVGGGSALTVVGFDGQIVKTIEGPHRALAINGDGSAVYAVTGAGQTLRVVDTTTLQSRDVDLGVCATSLAYTGGKLYFPHDSCAGGDQGVGAFDPATGEVRTGVIQPSEPATLVRAMPGRPDRLTVVGQNRFLGVYDVSATPPTVVAERQSEPTGGVCADAALASGGDLLVTACPRLSSVHEVFRTADLSDAPAVPTYGSPSAVAVTPDGRYVAAGTCWWEDNYGDVCVYDIATGTPGLLGRRYNFPGRLVQASLAFSDTGRLFAVERSFDTPKAFLNILPDATRHITRVTVSVPRALDYRKTAEITGAVSYPPGTVTSATAKRTDRRGSHDLGSVEVAADGSFRFSDTPDVSGPATYTVDYPGDAEHPAATGEASTVVRPLPYDVNGDGFAETIIGSPGEDVGFARDAGAFHVLYGGVAGLTGSGSLSVHQGTPETNAGPESGDAFGYATASGDFNLDGFADVIVSAPGEDVYGAVDGGMVFVFFGSAGGLRTDQAWTIDVYDLELALDDHARMGHALTVGDFGSDGIEDFVIGVPGSGPGYVFISNSNQDSDDYEWQRISQDAYGIPGENNPGDQFGAAVSAGDLDADGRTDLAVGAPRDAEDRGWATGSVTVIHGGPTDPGPFAFRWSKDTRGVPGASGSFNQAAGDSPDEFGRQVEITDLTGDGYDELVVAAPGAPVTVDGVRKRDAGTVTVMAAHPYWSAWATELTQQTARMPGTAGQEDHFGMTLAAGDANADGLADLAIHSPGDTYVTVVPGVVEAPSFGLPKAWTQDSPGIPGSSESGDNWGGALRFADLKGTGRCSLVVGAPGENTGRGAITAIHATSTGLTATGAQAFSQDSTGVPGVAEPGDHFGASL